MSNRNKLSPFEKAVIGSAASVIANTVVYPLDITKTLIQSQHNLSHYSKDEVAKNPNLYLNSVDCLKKLFLKHGLQGWYYGIVPSLSSTAASNFAYFFFYALVHKIYDIRYPKRVKSTAVELGLGAVAGALGQIIIMPISTVSTKQQTEIASDQEENDEEKENGGGKQKKQNQGQSNEKESEINAPSFIETAEKILKNDGLSGLWSGLKVSLVLTANPSITYGTFERLRSLLFSSSTNLSAIQSFSLGVLSKLLATVITMPLIVSKVMIQKKSTIVTEKVVDPVTGKEKFIKTRKDFKTFQECLAHVFKTDGFFGLWRGLLPQISKAVVVQGFLFMFKEQLEVLFITLLKYIKLQRRRKHLA